MLYQNNGDGTFTQVQIMILVCGLVGCCFWRMDRLQPYGLLDLPPNGLWSSGEENLDSLFFRTDITNYTDPLYRY